jgi:hypothetical protein
MTYCYMASSSPRLLLAHGIAGRADRAALVPVRITEPSGDGVAESRRGEPVTVLLRSGQMLKVGRDFDEPTFARVVALLERG